MRRTLFALAVAVGLFALNAVSAFAQGGIVWGG